MGELEKSLIQPLARFDHKYVQTEEMEYQLASTKVTPKPTEQEEERSINLAKGYAHPSLMKRSAAELAEKSITSVSIHKRAISGLSNANIPMGSPKSVKATHTRNNTPREFFFQEVENSQVNSGEENPYRSQKIQFLREDSVNIPLEKPNLPEKTNIPEKSSIPDMSSQTQTAIELSKQKLPDSIDVEANKKESPKFKRNIVQSSNKTTTESAVVSRREVSRPMAVAKAQSNSQEKRNVQKSVKDLRTQKKESNVITKEKELKYTKSQFYVPNQPPPEIDAQSPKIDLRSPVSLPTHDYPSSHLEGNETAKISNTAFPKRQTTRRRDLRENEHNTNNPAHKTERINDVVSKVQSELDTISVLRRKSHRNQEEKTTQNVENPGIRASRNVSVNFDDADSVFKWYCLSGRKPKPSILLPTVLKTISAIYTEKLRLSTLKVPFANPLNVMIYDHFLHKFGLRKVAENKLLQFLDSVLYFKGQSLRLKLFCKMAGITNETHLDYQDYTTYIESHAVFDPNGQGFSLITLSNEQIMIPLGSACTNLRQYLVDKIGLERAEKIVADICLTTVGKQESEVIAEDKIDLDYLLEKLTLIEAQHRMEIPPHLKILFHAADVL
eukprot:TRINITY_DN7086_c0_g1_i9.p1 TRINITY_DN7086_c0_g1~~TRINITY_DN7086_c0_g1_i9.p1  ORF type:complete len:613 (+),score=81.90 TRINITY_DN7086_c0_g1_i9:92-1930(+)